VAFRKKGVGYLKHLLQPFPVLLPLNIIDEVLRPITLAARLFFNIFVGELLFIIVASIIEARIRIGFFDLSIAVSIVPFFIQFFNFFVGTIQAFVFTLLAIVYLSLAIAEEH
jgi:F-type H+-transporting ATPase subunit a